ncbi:hypothetical protein HDU98_005548 [Podochytrium sp. JEL0797]|nr:hypothetical protein HDU98_005548 [Podochytrium sp. JEL0797]
MTKAMAIDESIPPSSTLTFAVRILNAVFAVSLLIVAILYFVSNTFIVLGIYYILLFILLLYLDYVAKSDNWVFKQAAFLGNVLGRGILQFLIGILVVVPYDDDKRAQFIIMGVVILVCGVCTLVVVPIGFKRSDSDLFTIRNPTSFKRSRATSHRNSQRAAANKRFASAINQLKAYQMYEDDTSSEESSSEDEAEIIPLPSAHKPRRGRKNTRNIYVPSRDSSADSLQYSVTELDSDSELSDDESVAAAPSRFHPASARRKSVKTHHGFTITKRIVQAESESDLSDSEMDSDSDSITSNFSDSEEELDAILQAILSVSDSETDSESDQDDMNDSDSDSDSDASEDDNQRVFYLVQDSLPRDFAAAGESDSESDSELEDAVEESSESDSSDCDSIDGEAFVSDSDDDSDHEVDFRRHVRCSNDSGSSSDDSSDSEREGEDEQMCFVLGM